MYLRKFAHVHVLIQLPLRVARLPVDATDDNEGPTFGYTALMWASARGMTRAVRSLVAAGADPAGALPTAIQHGARESACELLSHYNWLLDFAKVVVPCARAAEDLPM